MFHQIQQAIEPSILLSKIISKWGEFSKALAENPRKRKLQITNYTFS